MHYPRSKKGFTLVEIIVAILVMSLVFGMTTMLAVSISGYNKDKTHITTCHEEVARVQLFIKNWAKSLDDAFNTSYSVSQNGQQLSVRSGLYWFKDANNSFDLWFTESNKTITGDFYVNGNLVTKTESYTKINSIHFKLGNEDDLLANTARCLITLDDGSVYTLVLQKESSKAGLPVIFSRPFEQKVGGYNEFIFITSGDWDTELNATEYKNLEDLDKLSSFSTAYQYAALSTLRVQVDEQWRMSLESFTSAYGAKWQVRIFSASGKVAYGMKLLDSEFPAASHRLSFFIEEGSILFDGTPIEPMGYTRKPGAVGTLDWHDAAELTYVGDRVEGGIWWIDFDTNVFWDELDTTAYEQVQYDSIRKLYGLSTAFGAGIENGLYVVLNGEAKHLGALGDDDVYVTIDNTGTNGTVRIHIGLNAGQLRPGSSFEGDEVSLTFTTLFSLPDGTPLREENTFRCKVADYLHADFKKAVSASPAGEYFTGSNGSASGDPLVAYEQFHMEYYIHSPWTDNNHSSYLKLETKPSAYNLSEDFYTRLFDCIYIGVDGNEISLRNAISKYKLSVSLHKNGSDRMILRLTVNTADMLVSGYPLDLTQQVFSIRFGDSASGNNSVIRKPFCLPNSVPVRFISLARPAADFSSSHWLTRHTLSSKVNSSESGGTLYVDFFSSGLYQFAGFSFDQVLSQGRGFSSSLINSIRNKLELTIDGVTATVAEWGVDNFDATIFEHNGRWAMQLQIKNDLVTGKDLTIHFREGFVGPDATTLLVPIKFVRDGTNSWTGSASSDLYLPNRTVAINSTNTASHQMAVSLPSGSYSGSAPFRIYAKVKMENAGGTGSAAIILDYANSTDVTLATLTADTDGWVSLTEFYGGIPQMKKENASIVIKMDGLSGRVTVADLLVADNTGKVLYSMANDTTLYGVGDVRNVDGKYSNWFATRDSGVSYPIITRGDSRYIPNRILRVTVNGGYTGGDASLLISEKQFSDGVTYYVAGRIRTNVTGKTNGPNADSNSANVVVNGVGDSKYYGVPNGEWVALTNADGTPLSFIGGITEIPKELSTVHRQIGIHAKHDMTNGKMTIQTDAATAKFGANQKLIVRGYYQVKDFVSLASGGCAYIGDGATSGRVTVKENQTGWQYFRLEWNTNTNLDFEFVGAMGYLYIANLTIEDTSRKVVYDMSTDEELVECYCTDFPWAPSIWYITYFGEPNAMDFTVDAATSATPIQYTHSRNTAEKTLANGSEHRTLSIHSKYGTTNGKITIDADQFMSYAKVGAGTYTVRGFYKVEGFTSLADGGRYEIGDGATKGMESGSKNVTTWDYFELIWNTSKDLNFEFHGADGYIRLANVTIESDRYKRVYDMATDSALTESYRTSFPWNPSIWYITYFGQPSPTMDLSISAAASGTPMQYTATIGSVKRSMGIGSSGNTVNAKMLVYGSKFAAKYGAGTYTVSGYYSITSFNSLRSDADCIIGTGATSGTVHNKATTNGWTYFTLQWNTSNNLVFEFWYATGYMYLGNLTFIDANGNIDYDLSADTSLPTGWQKAFPQEPNFWYWGYSGAYSYVDMVIDPANGYSPSRNADGHSEAAIALSSPQRTMSIHASNYRQNGKMVITAAQAKAKFGANKTMIVRGYYKIEDYTGFEDNPWWQIGSNADSGNSQHQTGNRTSWEYFKLYWNTNNDLNFEFWNANGYIRLANLTIEDLNGGVWYDMSTDASLGGSSTTYHTTFPQQKGIWYITHEASLAFMDSSVSAVKTSATPKQYTAGNIVETDNSLANGSDKRQMGFGAQNGMQNGKMVITSGLATNKFGANKDMIVRGYYKVTGYKSLDTSGMYKIGTNSPDMITGTTSQETWEYFKLRWNTSTDLNFELWHANGYMYLTNLTIEYAEDDFLGDIVYDLSNDTNLYKDGTYIKGFYNFPQSASIWYFTRENVKDFFMDFVSTAVGSDTPKQYEEDWDYLKFSMWYATGSMEIADLTIYHYNGSTKVIDYSMATDSNFASDYSRVNTDSALFTVWRSDEWVTSGAINFSIYIDYNSNRPHYDSEYQVPKFTDVVG